MRKSIAIIISLCLVVIPLSSMAAIVTVTAEGTISEVYSTDDFYNLDGAGYSITFTYDTTSSPTNTVCNVAACQTVFDSVGNASFQVFNRPNSVSSASASFTGTYLLSNYFTIADTFSFPQAVLTGALDGLSIGNGIGVVLGDDNYFSGSEAVLQSPVLTVGQLVGGANYGLSGPGGNHSGRSLYQLSGEVTSVSTVPVPAAAWLFSSGLIGLIGVSRRNATK